MVSIIFIKKINDHFLLTFERCWAGRYICITFWRSHSLLAFFPPDFAEPLYFNHGPNKHVTQAVFDVN